MKILVVHGFYLQPGGEDAVFSSIAIHSPQEFVDRIEALIDETNITFSDRVKKTKPAYWAVFQEQGKDALVEVVAVLL